MTGRVKECGFSLASLFFSDCVESAKAGLCGVLNRLLNRLPNYPFKRSRSGIYRLHSQPHRLATALSW
jgi:hypothetical protein